MSGAEIGIHPYVMVVVLSGYENLLARNKVIARPLKSSTKAFSVRDVQMVAGHVQWLALDGSYHVQLVHDRRT